MFNLSAISDPEIGAPPPRTRADRCPGALRPWHAEDGLLVRLRVPGGRIAIATLVGLAQVATRYGDGRVHLTSRANLQLRALPRTNNAQLPHEVLAALQSTGLLPSLSHELIRNIMASPLTGTTVGGGCDLRPVVTELDQRLQDSPAVSTLAGRFLFVLDDGTGDLVARTCDLGAVGLDEARAQLRIGDRFGPIVAWCHVPQALTELAAEFADRRGASAQSPWHLAEFEAMGGRLTGRWSQSTAPTLGLPPPRAPLPFGPIANLEHLPVPSQGLSSAEIEALAQRGPYAVMTPWHGLLVPTLPAHPQELR